MENPWDKRKGEDWKEKEQMGGKKAELEEKWFGGKGGKGGSAAEARRKKRRKKSGKKRENVGDENEWAFYTLMKRMLGDG